MGKVDVMFTVGVHGNFQCEENDVDAELNDARERIEGFVEGISFPQNVGEVSVELVSIADVDPETGDLTQRVISEPEVNLN